MSSPHLILLMGVAGSGKTTVGKLLAGKLNWSYFEADDFHSEANKRKMSAGIPLDDQDRAPWLQAIRQRIDQCIAQNQSAVFTCSALKEKYRQTLVGNVPSVKLVYLEGSPALLQARLEGRQAHYMKTNMLQSQLADLEVPAHAFKVEIDQSPEAIVAKICAHYALS